MDSWTPDTTSAIPSNGTSSGGTSPNGGASIFDILGLILGIVGIVGLFQVIYAGIEIILPAQRLKALDTTMQDTIDQFTVALEDGLFPDPEKVKSIEDRLSDLSRKADRLRPNVHIAISFKQQLNGWWYGVSGRLNALKREVEAARADISIASSAERSKQERENRLPRSRILPANVLAASRAMHGASYKGIKSTSSLSALNPLLGRATGVTGLHASQPRLTARAHVHPPASSASSQILPPPPAFVPTPPTGASLGSSDPDPRQRLRDLTDQLSQAAGDYALPTALPALPTDGVDDGKVSASEIERTMSVLNDLAKRLSVIAAQELTRAQNGQASSTAGQVNSAQLSMLIDGLQVAHAAATQSANQSEDSMPSTATIEEVEDVTVA